MQLADLQKEALEERDRKLENFFNEYSTKISKDQMKLILSAKDVCELLNLLKQKKISAEEILITFALRACTLGKKYNWLADVDFEYALGAAKAADAKIKSDPFAFQNQPLIGIPISFYEQISIKGLKTTAGITNFAKNNNFEHSYFYKILKEQGAIPCMKSNVPQGFMSLESSNNLWGSSKNPFLTNKSTGGSNGGEAGLISTKCSPIGIGGDLFGSLRIPANFCGLYGLRPTAARNSKIGAILFNNSNFFGFQAFATSWGPIAKSVDDVILISKCIFGKFADDISVSQKPFDDKLYDKFKFNEKFNFNAQRVKVAYFIDVNENDNFYLKTSEPIRKTMEKVIAEAKEKLDIEFFEIKKDDLALMSEICELGLALLQNSNYVEEIKKHLASEKLQDFYQDLYTLRKNSKLTVKLKSLYNYIIGNTRRAKYLTNFNKMTREEYLDATKKLMEKKAEFYSFWKREKIDAILSPVFLTPAMDFGTCDYFMPFNNFAILHNILDLPAGCVPIENLNENFLYVPETNDDIDFIMQRNLESCRGLPTGIQIGAFPHQDELVLRLMKEIDALFNYESAKILMEKYPVEIIYEVYN